MDKLTDTMVTFAKTGTIGRLHVGLNGAELMTALADIGLSVDPEATPDYDDRVDSIEVHIADGILYQLGLDNLGDLTFQLPGTSNPISITMDEMLELLIGQHCAFESDPTLTFEGEQEAIRTAANVSITFVHPDEERSGTDYLTHSLYSTLR